MRYPSLIWWWPGRQRHPWIVTVWIGGGWSFTYYWPTWRLAWRDWCERSRIKPEASSRVDVTGKYQRTDVTGSRDA